MAQHPQIQSSSMADSMAVDSEELSAVASTATTLPTLPMLISRNTSSGQLKPKLTQSLPAANYVDDIANIHCQCSGSLSKMDSGQFWGSEHAIKQSHVLRLAVSTDNASLSIQQQPNSGS
eukprot:1158185-Pelagomonas_calceolata.AAC.1